ncbi:MAG: hypothetical protein ACSW8D_01730 [Prevotella sp.]|jgi:hypothetical protein
MMILPGDPLLYFFVVVGVLVYYAFKGDGKKTATKNAPLSKTESELQDEEFKRQDHVVELYKTHHSECFRNEYNRYVVWLYEHREGMRPKTLDEFIDDYAAKRRVHQEDREQRRLYEWWLYKQSEQYEQDKKQIERYINR